MPLVSLLILRTRIPILRGILFVGALSLAVFAGDYPFAEGARTSPHHWRYHQHPAPPPSGAG